MKAVVMAGGQGTRLRPLTSNQPKPMLPIVGQPMMQHVLRLARSHGCSEVVATVHFLASTVRNYFGDGSDLGMSLSYATEEAPLGTAGSVKNAESLLDDRFLVLSGDSLTDVDLTDLVRFHDSKGAAVTVMLKRVENPLEFGIVMVDEEGRVQRFLEKPGWGEVFSDTINTGLYLVEREVLADIPEGQEFDFAKDLFPKLLDRGAPMYGYVTDRYWTDIGTVDAYLAAHRAVLDREVQVELEGFELRGGIWLGQGSVVDSEAEVKGPVYVGENSRVEAGAHLREHSVIGRGVTVKSGAFLHRAVVHDYAYVGASSNLRGCVLGKNADVKQGARLEDGVVVADDCYVGDGAVLQPGVKVYPFKYVDPGAIVSKSIIWQSGGARGLFGERGVAGLINVDVTPELAMRLAMAYASLIPKGSICVACRDLTRAAGVFSRSMLVGMNAGGVDCHDLEVAPAPMARFYARSARAAGGFTVRTAPFDPTSVEVQFFDRRGVDVAPGIQRQLERGYHRDDLRRAFHHDIGELTVPARAFEYYVQGLMEAVDVEALRERRPKIVLDYGYGTAALTGPRALGRIGAEVMAVNAVLDEDRTIGSQRQRDEALEALRRSVRASGADLGALLDGTGERLFLVDGAARSLDPRRALLAFVSLVMRTAMSLRIALPVTTSRVAERIVRARGGEVMWTPISPSALMTAGEEGGAAFGGDEEGGYIFPRFLPSFDALMSLVRLLEMLARAGTTLEAVVDGLPEAHVVRRDVPTPWESKGVVMRHLMEHIDNGRVETIDGVKAYRGEDWALVIPHPQEPLVRVWAEAGSARAAEELAGEFASLVTDLRA